jgi:hypothetical protein
MPSEIAYAAYAAGISLEAPGEPLPAALGVAYRLALILAHLAALVSRGLLGDPRRVGLILPLWRYITRTARRFGRLAAAHAAGKPPKPRVRKPHSGPRAVRLPQGRAWLVVALRHHAAAYAGQLAYLLAQPDAAALVAGSPRAQHLLRPLCRMLGIAPACIPPLPKRPRKPRPKPAPKPKRLTRKQLEALLWYPNIEGRPMKLIPPRRRFRA